MLSMPDDPYHDFKAKIPCTEFTMSEERWEECCKIKKKLTPDILVWGLPPLPNLTDSYHRWWMKLVLREFHKSITDFSQDQKYLISKSKPEFQCSITKRKKNVFATIFLHNSCETMSDFLSTIRTPLDLIKSFLYLENGEGWLYVNGLCGSTLEPVFPVKANVSMYTKNFDPMLEINENKKISCVYFESFSSCIYRWKSLIQYEVTVSESIRCVIETGKPQTHFNMSETCLRPMLDRSRSKLNAIQFDILCSLREPVDYVQGPPGTGKSTFIVELVKHRIPQDHLVLICTTTNKAIDSLAEKLETLGTEYQERMLCVGSPTRLGDTSAKYHFDNRILIHRTTLAFSEVVAILHPLNRRCENMLKFIDLNEPKPSNFDIDDSLKFDDKILIWEVERMGKKKKLFQSLYRYATKILQDFAEAFIELISTDYVMRLSGCVIKILLQAKKTNCAQNFDDLILHIQKLQSALSEAQLESVKNAVVRDIITTAQYFLCTAATAATINERIRKELISNGVNKKDNLILTELFFPYVLVDECGAMLQPDLIGVISHGCQFLLCVGDSRQLKPFSRWREANQYQYLDSLLSHFIDNDSEGSYHNLMQIQYRMHPHIAEIVSTTFYGGKLITAPNIIRNRQRDSPVKFVDVKNGVEIKSGFSFWNREEVTAVVKIVQEEYERLQRNQIINVIAFHKPQKLEIIRQLKLKKLMQSEKNHLVNVITVDAMQGREADIVVLTCVRTGSWIGFLNNKNRLNVALSRAKEMLYVVGNLRTLNKAKHHWKLVMKSLTQTKTSTPELLESFNNLSI